MNLVVLETLLGFKSVRKVEEIFLQAKLIQNDYIAQRVFLYILHFSVLSESYFDFSDVPVSNFKTYTSRLNDGTDSQGRIFD